MYSEQQIPVLQKIVLLRNTKFTTLEIKDIIQRCNEVDILAYNFKSNSYICYTRIINKTGILLHNIMLNAYRQCSFEEL